MRQFTKYINEPTELLLKQLAENNTTPDTYRVTMNKLGHELSVIIARKVEAFSDKTVCIACTVEDADFLAKGIIDGLLENNTPEDQIRLACFWNESIIPFEDEGLNLHIAPILKQYKEPFDLDDSILVVVKSIISGACVVKTNLSNLIEKAKPQKVFVVSPVMYKGAEDRLAAEFDKAISDQFEYLTFAIDDEKSENGKDVVPGIGGSVYARLGLKDGSQKNSYVPEIVKSRRRVYFASPSKVLA